MAQFPPGSAPRRLIEAFVDPSARLLITGEVDGEPVARLAHEALLTEWGRAREVLGENRLYLGLRRQTEERYLRWREKPVGTRLLSGDDLADGERLLRARALPLPDGVSEFVARSARRSRWNCRRTVTIAKGLSPP